VTARNARKITAAAAAGAATALILTACGGESLEERDGGGSGGSGGEDGGRSLTVGGADFTEARIMAELYAQLLRDRGYDTSIETLESRELYEPELERGRIDVVPEYAATLAEFLNDQVNGTEAPGVASADVDDTVAALRDLAEPRGLTVLDPGEAVDQNAFAVHEDFAAEHDLSTLSDLGASGLSVTLAAGDDCPERPFCQPGLEETYGIEIDGVDPLGVGTVNAKRAVQNGEDEMVLVTTTDATLEEYDLVLLEDDRNLQQADNLLPVVNTESAGDPEIAQALDELTQTLTTDDLIELNRQVDLERRKARDVAAEYLEEHGLLG
jgi:osmoprotectant transport system substrate-binding protein